MKIFKIILVLLTSICLPKDCYLQQEMFSKEDDEFFKNKIPRYGKWLEYQGFDTLLNIYEIDTDTNMVTLILESNFVSADTTKSLWNKLKNNYDEINVDSFEERLFKYFCYVMEVPEEMAVIEVYNEIKDGKIPCFYRGLYVNDIGKFSLESSFCKNQSSTIEIEDFLLKPNITVKETHLPNVSPDKLIKVNLKKELEFFFKDYFEKRKGAKIIKRNAKDALMKFEISNIKREILTDEANPSLGKFLNWCCNTKIDWVKRELITVEVYYEKINAGLKIKVDINGKYGSGYHLPRRNGYIEMEPEFESYVSAYSEIIAEEISSYLTRTK